MSPTGGSSMAAVMLQAMLVMALAAWAYAIAVALSRVRTIILEREADAQWVRRLVHGDRAASLPAAGAPR